MRIKAKLNLGIGLLFTLIILLAFLTIKQISVMAAASENIIKDNKETLVYTRIMLKALSETNSNRDAFDTFDKYLQKQKMNITEAGEKELTEIAESNFNKFRNDTTDTKAFRAIESALFGIMQINLKSIDLKNSIASKTATRSILLVSIMSLLFLIIALLLLIKLPGNISNPINELIRSIKLIAANDYSQRVNFISHSELGELATTFNDMASHLGEKYRKLDLAKTNFIATISHELKTPISAMKFSLQLLKNENTGTLNSDQLELINSCEEDSDHLLKIISELLNTTQAETGNIQLNMMPANVKEMVQYAVNTVRPTAEKRNIRIGLDLPDDLPFVNADKDKSAWVLTNLISNAIRYSNDNSFILISGTVANEYLLISVCDKGQGIDPKYREKIFDRYFRVPGTNREGSGLGLAISKEFIEAQGGRISVESEPGEGSTFTISFIVG